MESQTAIDSIDGKKTSTRNRRRRLTFRLLAVALGLVPFLILEFSLRLFGFGDPLPQVDPFQGFGKTQRVFELDSENGVYTTNSKLLWHIERQNFAATKPASEFRIFCLGGSTVRGWPYTNQSAFPRWMQLELAAGDSSKTYEVVNCGGLTYGSRRVAATLNNVLEHKPNLIVLAVGHNEFLEDRMHSAVGEAHSSVDAGPDLTERVHFLRTVTLAKKIWHASSGKTGEETAVSNSVKARLFEFTRHDAYHRENQSRERVVQEFETRLRSMVARCRSTKTPLVLLKLGSNLRDCPPFKSEPISDANPDAAEKRREFDEVFQAARAKEKGHPNEALSLYRKAAAIDPEHALVHYRTAKLCDRLEKWEAAKTHYQKAKDHDICPLRIHAEVSRVIERVAAETKTPLIDVKALLERASPQGIPGYDTYMDHVHPTIGGHQRIAGVVAEKVRRMIDSNTAPFEWPAAERRRAFRRQMQSAAADYFTNCGDRIQQLDDWAHRAGTPDTGMHRTTRDILHRGHYLANVGREDDAWKEYETAIRHNPTAKPHLIQRALALFQQGRVDDSRRLLERLSPVVTGRSRTEVEFAKFAIAFENGELESGSLTNRSGDRSIIDLPRSSPWIRACPRALAIIRERTETTR